MHTVLGYTTEMLLSLGDSIMKEDAAAFMHIEYGTENSSVLQSLFYFSSGENTLTHFDGCTREEENAQFPPYIFQTVFITQCETLKKYCAKFQTKHAEILCD